MMITTLTVPILWYMAVSTLEYNNDHSVYTLRADGGLLTLQAVPLTFELVIVQCRIDNRWWILSDYRIVIILLIKVT